MGAIMAAGVASVAPMVRITFHKGIGIPDWLLGLAEDYLALKLGTQALGMTMDEVKGVAQGRRRGPRRAGADLGGRWCLIGPARPSRKGPGGSGGRALRPTGPCRASSKFRTAITRARSSDRRGRP